MDFLSDKFALKSPPAAAGKGGEFYLPAGGPLEHVMEALDGGGEAFYGKGSKCVAQAPYNPHGRLDRASPGRDGAAEEAPSPPPPTPRTIADASPAWPPREPFPCQKPPEARDKAAHGGRREGEAALASKRSRQPPLARIWGFADLARFPDGLQSKTAKAATLPLGVVGWARPIRDLATGELVPLGFSALGSPLPAGISLSRRAAIGAPNAASQPGSPTDLSRPAAPCVESDTKSPRFNLVGFKGLKPE
uniref:Uncharacterized protein n=1 Tax=Sphaerodactylus townsendi TaxID=933632 RepID=A0ACB8FNQ9_9SAUR